ncbi:MAG: TetR/AcrR family transcriptional regulator [Aeromicrobium sp.]
MVTVKSSRREKAQATRTAILRAAHAEFAENGFHGATITAIAKRARVAPQTVYFVFHTKSELISAVIDIAVMGEEDPLPPEETPWFAAMLAELDPAECLRMFVRGAGGSYDRAAAVSEVLRAAALTDDELRAVHEHHEGLRRTAYRGVIEMLAEKGELRSELTVDTATDVFLTVYGDSAYTLLRTEHGWSHEQVMDWLSDALPAILLAGH